MDKLLSRPYVHPKDQERIVELLLTYRVATSVQMYPTIWRSCLLLASRVWEPAHDTCLWEDSSGRIAGFAILWRRRREDAYLVLDRFVEPELVTDDLTGALLGWGVQRAQQIATEQATPLTLYTNGINPAFHSDNHLESYGFRPVTPDPQEYNVYFVRSLQTPLPALTLPAGYTIQLLRGFDELEKYSTLYDFAAVNAQHRQELLASDEYSHLVVVDPSGMFVAYCECSIYRAEWQHSGQRIGWIDYIGTHPEKRQQGWGRAILLASLHQLQAWGTEMVKLITVSTNIPAIRLYETMGFTRVAISELPHYERKITSSNVSDG